MNLRYNTVHHVEKKDTNFIKRKQENLKTVQTSHIVAVIEEIKQADDMIRNKNLNVKDVEVELELTFYVAKYVDDDLFKESFKGDIMKVEVLRYSFSMLRPITDLEKILEANYEDENQIDEEVNLILNGETDGIIFQSSEATKQFIEELKENLVMDPTLMLRLHRKVMVRLLLTQMRKLILINHLYIQELCWKERVLKY